MVDQKKKILFVEEDKYLTKIYGRKLEMNGFEVIYAVTGQEGLNRLTQGKVDVVLLDLILPGLDGFEFIKRVRADQDLKDLPIVVLSNLGQDTDIKRAMDLGANDYMVKTNYTLNQVVDKVKEWTSK